MKLVKKSKITIINKKVISNKILDLNFLNILSKYIDDIINF